MSSGRTYSTSISHTAQRSAGSSGTGALYGAARIPSGLGQLVAAFQIAQQLGTDAFTQRTAQQIGGKFLFRCGFEDV